MPNLNGVDKIMVEMWGCHPGTFSFMQMDGAVDCLILPYAHVCFTVTDENEADVQKWAEL